MPVSQASQDTVVRLPEPRPVLADNAAIIVYLLASSTQPEILFSVFRINEHDSSGDTLSDANSQTNDWLGLDTAKYRLEVGVVDEQGDVLERLKSVFGNEISIRLEAYLIHRLLPFYEGDDDSVDGAEEEVDGEVPSSQEVLWIRERDQRDMVCKFESVGKFHNKQSLQ